MNVRRAACVVSAMLVWAPVVVAQEVGAVPGGTAAECGDQGLVLLVRQSELFVRRAPRKSSFGRSMLMSIAATALTGGAATISMIDRGDPGATMSAPVGVVPEFEPKNLAAALTAAFEAEAVPGRVVLPAQHDHAAMMALLASRHCAQAVVVALEYKLEQQGNVSYWYWNSHVSRVSPAEDAIESLVGELEYRSSLVPFSLDRHAPSPSEGFGQWLAAKQAALREQLNVGIAETVNLTREALTPAAQRAVAVPIGALVSSVVCADCSKMDLLVKQSPSRVWLQPTGQSHLWRSLPVKG